VLADRMAQLVDLGHRLTVSEDPFDAVAVWLRATLRHGLTYRGLSAVVMNSALDRDQDMVAGWHAQLFDVGAGLLTRAWQTGAVRAEATTADVLKLVGAIAWAAHDSPDREAQAERLLVLLLNGLRTPPDIA
jgi:hypothetical protein